MSKNTASKYLNADTTSKDLLSLGKQPCHSGYAQSVADKKEPDSLTFSKIFVRFALIVVLFPIRDELLIIPPSKTSVIPESKFLSQLVFYQD